MNHLTALRSYAQAPNSLPPSILYRESSNNIVVFDGYPKSIFHFLVLPLANEPKLSFSRLNNLQSLLSGDKETAKQVVDNLAKDAQLLQKDIEDEMINKYGFKWDVWSGFHASPSMVHLHLHVLSSDLCSPTLKKKKHYNSFHPKLGFFLHLEEVMSWFEAESSFFANKIRDLKPKNYEPMLKEALVCFRCNSEFKNIPALKGHLQEDWDKLERRANAVAKAKSKKRKLSQDPEAGTPEASSSTIVESHENEPRASSEEVVEPNEKRTKIDK